MKLELNKKDKIALRQRKRLFEIKDIFEDCGSHKLLDAVMLAISDNESHMSTKLRRHLMKYGRDGQYYPPEEYVEVQAVSE